MKKIYLLLMHTHTIPARLVKTFTRYEYSHVALSLDKDCYTVYSFGRRKVDSVLNGGFSVENKDGQFFNKFNKTQCKIYEATVSDKQYDFIKEKFENMQKTIDDYKYDFIGIIPRFFKIKVIFENKYVCSQFIATVLEDAKICKFDKNVCFATPKDFEELDNFYKIYKGSYLEYKG